MSRTITKLLIPLAVIGSILSPSIAAAHDLSPGWDNASTSKTLWVGPVASWCSTTGNYSNLVGSIQAMMIDGGYYLENGWTNTPGAQLDGVFGSKTLAAIKHFQTVHGLSPDGCVGPATWNTMRYNDHMTGVGDGVYAWDESIHHRVLIQAEDSIRWTVTFKLASGLWMFKDIRDTWYPYTIWPYYVEMCGGHWY